MSRKHVRRSGTIAVRSPLTFRIQTAFMALTLLISLGCAVVPPVTAADFSGGVGIFLPVSPLNADNLTYWVTPKTKLAKSYGLQFVNLVVNWADLEPADDSFNFKTLQNYIKAVQGQGMKVVLRVYFNGGDWLQAAPNWLFDSRKAQFYYEGSQRQPVPWDSVYLEEMGEFAMKLGLWLRDNGTIVPDAIQISAGESTANNASWVLTGRRCLTATTMHSTSNSWKPKSSMSTCLRISAGTRTASWPSWFPTFTTTIRT